MAATSLDLSQIKTDALSSAATFRTLVGLGSSDAVTFDSVSVPADSFFGISSTGSRFFPRSSSFRLYAANTLLVEGTTDSVNFNTSVQISGGVGTVVLRLDAADTLALHRSTNSQAFRLYNTRTSSTSFERLNVRWDTNELIIDAEAGSGGGTLRGIKLGSASTSLLGFYGATPVDQPLTVSDPAGGGTVDTEARTAIGAIIDRLQELGLIA